MRDKDAGFHISMMYEPDPKDKRGKRLEKEYEAFLKRHFPDNKPITKEFPTTVVSSGSTYQLQGTSPFEKELNDIARRGTKKDWAHISLD